MQNVGNALGVAITGVIFFGALRRRLRPRVRAEPGRARGAAAGGGGTDPAAPQRERHEPGRTGRRTITSRVIVRRPRPRYGLRPWPSPQQRPESGLPAAGRRAAPGWRRRRSLSQLELALERRRLVAAPELHRDRPRAAEPRDGAAPRRAPRGPAARAQRAAARRRLRAALRRARARGARRWRRSARRSTGSCGRTSPTRRSSSTATTTWSRRNDALGAADRRASRRSCSSRRPTRCGSTLHPRGMAPRIVNLAEWSAHLLHRLRRQASITGDPELERLHEELAAYPGVSTEPPHDGITRRRDRAAAAAARRRPRARVLQHDLDVRHRRRHHARRARRSRRSTRPTPRRRCGCSATIGAERST